MTVKIDDHTKYKMRSIGSFPAVSRGPESVVDPPVASEVPRSVGARVLRREDPRFLTGQGTYVDDVQPPGLLHAAFVRSDHAHANLLGIETADALAVPGVHAVITAEELAGEVMSMRTLVGTPGYQECDMPVLATGKVRVVGEPVALVVADSRYSAEDGAAAARVAYEPLPAVLEIADALAEDAPAIHADVPDNLYNSFETATEGHRDRLRGRRRTGRAGGHPAALRRRGARRPGGDRLPGGGDRLTSGSPARSPTSPAPASPSSSASPSRGPGYLPRRRRRLRSQVRGLPGGGRWAAASGGCTPAGQVDERPKSRTC